MQVQSDFKNVRSGLLLPDGELNVLTGPNNSGKSAILQYLNSNSPISGSCDYVSPRRFDLSNEVAIALNSDQELRNLWSQRKSYNPQAAEFNAPDAIRELVGLPDVARQRIVDWHNLYFGELKIERSNPDNEFAPPRITIDGRLATTQGSGSRSVLAVLCSLLHPERDTILIDEPELGIEPQVQKRLSSLVQAVSRGEEGLPKKRVYVATHSHIFLDRVTLTNNYVVTKGPDGFAKLKRIETPEEMHSLIFNLLGNSPDDLFFPDNILIVEGPSDQTFLRRLLELSGAGGIAVHYAGGEGGVAAALPAIEQMLKTQAYIPWYRQRICVLVDGSVPDARLKEWVSFLGDDGRRVRRLAHNGIEYYYPPRVMTGLTGLSADSLPDAVGEFIRTIRLGARRGQVGAFIGSKRELATEVVDRMSGDDLAGLDPVLVEIIGALKANRFSVASTV